MNRPRPWDAVIVGAGPAGSTAAALLARRGHRVLVLEKEPFPRFHIGESLLPAGLGVLDRLGLAPEEETFVYKSGARFVCGASGRWQAFQFAEALGGCPPHAWHVDRARFDTLLRDRARAAGAEVRHRVQVDALDLEAECVRVRTDAGVFEARFLIDATGQGRLLAAREGTAAPYRAYGNTAVFTHFQGLRDGALESLQPGNEIRIVLLAEGWGWLIPLPGRRLSVGVVSRGRAGRSELQDGFLASPLVRRLTAGGRRLGSHIVSNYGFRNTRPNGPRFTAVGDAACFLDPIFSSGVMFAMRGAELIADRLGPALEEEREAEPGLLDGCHRQLGRGYRTIAAMVDRFYNTRFARNVLLGEAQGQPLRPGILSVLAGDVFRHDNPFQELLLRAPRRDRGRPPGSEGASPDTP